MKIWIAAGCQFSCIRYLPEQSLEIRGARGPFKVKFIRINAYIYIYIYIYIYTLSFISYYKTNLQSDICQECNVEVVGRIK